MADNVIPYKIKRNAKKPKSLILLYRFGSRAQKLPKNGSLNRDLFNFCIGMVYSRCFLVNPHVQAVQNMSGKGGWRMFQAELRAGEVYPIFRKREAYTIGKK